MFANLELVVQEIREWYQTTITAHIDPRSGGIMVSSIFVPFSIVSVYLLVVKRWGPQFMAHRAALKIERIIIVYNFLQIIACFYVFWNGARLIINQNYSILCQPVDPAVNEVNNAIAALVFTYYMIKITDLFDTVFFVLRKKFSHVSFLHIYHHSGMVFVAYLANIFSLNGHLTLLGIINSFVHVMMYGYYLVTALFPDKKPSMMVKKSITLLQLAQFCILLVHEALPLFQPTCQVHKLWCVLLVAQYTIMIAMFSDFYVKTYSSPKVKKFD